MTVSEPVLFESALRLEIWGLPFRLLCEQRWGLKTRKSSGLDCCRTMLRSAPGEKQSLFIGNSCSTVVRRRFKTVLRRLSLLWPFSPIFSSLVKSPDINQKAFGEKRSKVAEIRKELLFYKTNKTPRNCGRSFLLSYGLFYGLFHVFYDQSTDFVAQTERCISDCATGTFIFGTFHGSHSNSPTFRPDKYHFKLP